MRPHPCRRRCRRSAACRARSGGACQTTCPAARRSRRPRRTAARSGRPRSGTSERPRWRRRSRPETGRCRRSRSCRRGTRRSTGGSPVGDTRRFQRGQPEHSASRSRSFDDLIGVALLDHAPPLDYVLSAVKHHCSRRQSIASGPPYFLLICFAFAGVKPVWSCRAFFHLRRFLTMV